MKANEKKIRIVVTILGFVLIGLYVGIGLAAKYLIGGIAAGLVALGIVMIWNRIS